MPTVTVSSKYQIVIPKEVRETLHIHPGEKFSIFEYEDRIEFIPIRKVNALRGVCRGMDTTVERGKDRV